MDTFPLWYFGHISPVIFWDWLSNHNRMCEASLICGVVSKAALVLPWNGRPDSYALTGNNDPTHPHFPIEQTNANKAAAEILEGLRNNWTRWRMNVGRIEGIEIELNQMAAKMGGLADWAGSWESTLRPGHVPAFILPFLQFLFIAFSIVFSVIWNAIVCQYTSHYGGFYWGNLGWGPTFFYQIFSDLFCLKSQGSFSKRGKVAK